MGILDGILGSEAAKTVNEYLSAVGNAVYDAGAYVANTAYDAGTAVVNTAYEAGTAVVSGVSYAAATTGSVVGEAAGLWGDPNAPRAHQVVTARRLLKDGKSDSPEYLALPEDVRQQVENEPASQGRRKDIEQEFQEQLEAWEAAGGEGEAPIPPLVVKLAVGGSGDAAWRTHCDIKGVLTDEGLKATKQQVGKAKTVYYTGSREHSWNFAGPGGPGSETWVGGMSDTGSNSIVNLVENASGVVANAVLDALQGEERPIVILVKGHSRGAVAAGHIADKLKEVFPNARVELTQVDPVPGPMQSAANQEINVGSLDESTVVYGVYSGHGVSFTPQKVLGAKRIIISQQAHGVGIQNGFIYGDRLFKGSSLNSLQPGVYRDQNSDISRAGELELIGTPDDVRKTFVEVYTRRYPPKPGEAPGMSGQNWDRDRKERIEAALEEYLSRLPKEELAQVTEEVMEKGFEGNLTT
jgi:hypothetical protein